MKRNDGAKLLRAWLAHRGLSNRQAAAELGVSHTTIADWMSGEKRPRIESGWPFIVQSWTRKRVPWTAWYSDLEQRHSKRRSG